MTGAPAPAILHRPKFLAVYAGLYVSISTLMRPARLSLAIACAPMFDSALNFIMKKCVYAGERERGGAGLCPQREPQTEGCSVCSE